MAAVVGNFVTHNASVDRRDARRFVRGLRVAGLLQNFALAVAHLYLRCSSGFRRFAFRGANDELRYFIPFFTIIMRKRQRRSKRDAILFASGKSRMPYNLLDWAVVAAIVARSATTKMKTFLNFSPPIAIFNFAVKAALPFRLYILQSLASDLSLATGHSISYSRVDRPSLALVSAPQPSLSRAQQAHQILDRHAAI
jgi:hypothetical protein